LAHGDNWNTASPAGVIGWRHYRSLAVAPINSRVMEPSVSSDLIGIAALTLSAFVPLWTARVVLTLLLTFMAKSNLQR
jgi:hypothetical protein